MKGQETMQAILSMTIYIILLAIISRILWVMGYKQHSKFLVAHSLLTIILISIFILLLGCVPMYR